MVKEANGLFHFFFPREPFLTISLSLAYITIGLESTQIFAESETINEISLPKSPEEYNEGQVTIIYLSGI